MSSFFSSKSRSLVRISSQSDKSSDGSSGFENRLSFSKMRKKRPPPISISVAGNVIITNSTSTSRAVYAELPWSASNPPTPRMVTCSNPNCMTREAILMASPTEAQFKLASPGPSCVCQPCNKAILANTSHRTPRQEWYPVAELPGPVTSSLTFELDAPSDISKSSYYNSEESLSDALPPLSLGPRTKSFSAQTEDLPCPQEKGPVRYGKTLREMDYDELMETLPDLTPEQIRVYWNPAIRKQLCREIQEQCSPISVSRSVMWNSQISSNREELERVKAECEIRLNTKENEVTGLLRLHDSRVDSLCSFITKHLGDELERSNEEGDQAAKEIISVQQRRGKAHFDADLQHMHQSQQIQELQNHISKLEPIAIRNEKRARVYKLKIKGLKEDITMAREDEQRLKEDLMVIKGDQERLKQEIAEKDAYIDMLNSKVTQLLTMRPDPGPASDTRGSGKHLPSPAPCDWGRAREARHEVAA